MVLSPFRNQMLLSRFRVADELILVMLGRVYQSDPI